MTNTSSDTILIAIDGSHNSLLAAGVGARLAGMLGAHVGLVHVLDFPDISFWGGVESLMRDDIRAQAETTLKSISERMGAVCKVMPEFYIVEGVAEVEIARIISEDPQITMVVTGRRGLTTEKRSQLLPRRSGRLGSRLSEMLPVPVLVVPPDVPDSHLCASLAELRHSP